MGCCAAYVVGAFTSVLCVLFSAMEAKVWNRPSCRTASPTRMLVQAHLAVLTLTVFVVGMCFYIIDKAGLNVEVAGGASRPCHYIH